METTFDIDKTTIEPLGRFVSSLDTPVPDVRDGARPGAMVKLRALLSADLVTTAVELHAQYTPLVNVETVRNEYAVPLQQQEAIRQETHDLAAEICHLIEARAVRHKQLEEMLEPRIGHDPVEHATNLRNMANRIETHEAALAEAGIDLGLWPTHSQRDIRKQLDRDAKAAEEIARLKGLMSGNDQKRVELRGKVEKLQPRINRALETNCEKLSHDELVTLGLYEKPKTRPKTGKRTGDQDKTKPATKPGPVAGGGAGATGDTSSAAGGTPPSGDAPPASAPKEQG